MSKEDIDSRKTYAVQRSTLEAIGIELVIAQREYEKQLNMHTHDSHVKKRPNREAIWLTSVHSRLNRLHCTAGFARNARLLMQTVHIRQNRLQCTSG